MAGIIFLQEISKDEYEMKMMNATSGKQFKLSWDVKAHQRSSLWQLWTAINIRRIFISHKYRNMWYHLHRSMIYAFETRSTINSNSPTVIQKYIIINMSY